MSSRSLLEALLSRSATWSLWLSISGDPLRDRDLLLGERDLLGDLDRRLLDLLSRDRLRDRGLPVRERVLARESGDPDLDLVLARPPDIDLDRLLPILAGDLSPFPPLTLPPVPPSSIFLGDPDLDFLAGLGDRDAIN